MPPIVDDMSDRSQLTQLAKEPLLESDNLRRCAANSNILRLRNWTAADTVIIYAPCSARTSGQLEASFLFTLKFDEVGNWKIVDIRRISRSGLDSE